jgi:hypothetical protein
MMTTTAAMAKVAMTVAAVNGGNGGNNTSDSCHCGGGGCGSNSHSNSNCSGSNGTGNSGSGRCGGNSNSGGSGNNGDNSSSGGGKDNGGNSNGNNNNDNVDNDGGSGSSGGDIDKMSIVRWCLLPHPPPLHRLRNLTIADCKFFFTSTDGCKVDSHSAAIFCYSVAFCSWSIIPINKYYPISIPPAFCVNNVNIYVATFLFASAGKT